MSKTQAKIDALGNAAVLRLMITVMYDSPWARLADWAWKSGTLVFDDWGNTVSGGVKEDGLRYKLGVWADNRDHKWREKYVRRGVEPSARWKVKRSSR